MTEQWFPSRWPAQFPDRIQLYSAATPNGRKVGIMLEELGLPYEPHRIDLSAGDQRHPEFLRINPNGKIPCIVDPSGPEGASCSVFESGVILLYLAEKARAAGNTNSLMPQGPHERWEAMQWLFFQMAGFGPMIGQFGHFYKFARDKTSDDYGVNRYSAEAKRLLGVLDGRLAGREYVVGDAFSLVDIALYPWVLALDFYGGKDHLGYATFRHIEPWVERCGARPAVQRGLVVCASSAS